MSCPLLDSIGAEGAEEATKLLAEGYGWKPGDPRYAGMKAAIDALHQIHPKIASGLDLVGPDGLTDAEREIDPDPAHWNEPQGAPADDSSDTKIP